MTFIHTGEAPHPVEWGKNEIGLFYYEGRT